MSKERQVNIQAASVKLDGIVAIPKEAEGLVIFAMGAAAGGSVQETDSWSMFCKKRA